MRVFLIPVGPNHHLPYCEPADSFMDAGDESADRGVVAGLIQRFRAVLAAAEQSRQRGAGLAAPGWFGRLKQRVLAWIADRIAEQRLLWQLRGCAEATLVYPSDLPDGGAMPLLRAELTRDRDRHRVWLIVHSVLFLLSGVLAIVPGPNLIAYYFAFRLVGHYLSMRGAGQGLERVRWHVEESPALYDLRSALGLDAGARQVRVQDIATRLDLPHLVHFVERVAFKGA